MLLNEFICNGKSTYDFPFYIVCEVLAAPSRADKKDRIYNLPFTNGVVKQSVNAFEPIVKEYVFYLHNVTDYQFREFKAFLGDDGWFTAYDEPNVRYEFIKTEFESDVLDDVGGYSVTVTFTCQPFAYEPEYTEPLGDTIINLTNAPMYPFIKISGQIGQETYLTIGEQTMWFKEIQDEINIECKHGLQDVWASGGRKVNNETKGNFFEIQPGTHKVTKGDGITDIQITYRWGWR